MFSKSLIFGALLALIFSACAGARATYVYEKNSTVSDIVNQVNNAYFPAGSTPKEAAYASAVSEFWYLATNTPNGVP